MSLPDRSMRALEDELEVFAAEEGWDWGLRIEVAHECAWSAELRVTTEPNRTDGPDRSNVTYATGGESPADVAWQAWQAMRGWMGQ